MNVLPPEFSSEPRLYGGVELDEDEKLVLELPVKFGLYQKLNVTQCKIDTEEALNKLRWFKIIQDAKTAAPSHHVSTDGEDNEEGEDSEVVDDKFEFINDHKVVEINNLRPTSLPYNPTVKMPWSVGDLELDIHRFKRDVENLARKSKRYTKKWSNLEEARARGLEKLRNRVSKKEIVCFETDKSGRWSIDTPENYREACKLHLSDFSKTPIINEQEHEEGEKLMNAEALSLLQMLGINQDASGDRLRNAVIAQGIKLPPFYGTRKDHKDVPPEFEERGPKVRPVCGAEDCITKRLSYILCLIGSQLLEGEYTHCDSTVNLLEEIERVNRSDQVNQSTIIGSLDVDALYPSLNIDRCARVFRNKLFESKLKFPGLSWKSIALYLHYRVSEQDLVEEGIQEYCPQRRTNRGHPPEFWANGVKRDDHERFGPWVFSSTPPDEITVRRMFCIAIENMIKVTMSLHDFQFEGTIYRQNTGGSIGLDLTGVLSDVYMCYWDKELKKKCLDEMIRILLYKRYKDDVNIGLDTTDSPELHDKNDEAVMKHLKKLADSMDENLTVSTDYCSNNDDRKTPILDLKVWVAQTTTGEWKILHSHYTKEVSSRQVMHSHSSHGERMKKNVMINEIDRIMRNSSPHLTWNETIIPSVEYYVRRMLYSGYSKLFIYDCLSIALKKYDARVNRFQEGKSYYELRDERENVKKKVDWYVEEGKFESVMFVEATVDSHYKKNVEKLVQKHKLRVRVVERAGQTVKQVLQRSDPFQRMKCEKEDCFICRNDIPINCRERGVCYQLQCSLCGRLYRGQTSRSEYERLKEHLQMKPKTPLCRHKELFHPNENFDITVKILAKCFGKPTRRKITEAVLIDELSDNQTMNNKKEWTYTRLNKL